MIPKRLTCSVATLLVLFAVVVMNKTATQTFALQVQNENLPVAQTRKNIQVLKELPERQLFPLMNTISTSLGVKCDYCHIKNGKNPKTGGDNWIWDLDDNPKKLIGRRMIKMVLDINRTNFNGETFVTCQTCHRGSTVPERLPVLPPHQENPVAATLPSAEQILTKYVTAVGGKDAVAKFGTVFMKGTIERTDNRSGPVEVTLKDADKYLITVTVPQGIVSQGVNGDVGWLRSASGSLNLKGRNLEQLKRVASYYGVIKVVDQPAQMKVLGAEKVGDRETYVLALVIDPTMSRRFYFDTQTGLLLREVTLEQTILAPLTEQADFEDYRDVDGVKLPFTIRTSDPAPYDTATRRFTEIRHNVPVDDTIFSLAAAPR